MRAVVQQRYGPPEDVLSVVEVDAPFVGDDEVLVRVRAASVHPDVWHVVTGRPRVLRIMGAGLRRPKNPVPGTDVAGVVESVGRDVTRFQPGDEVFGETIRGMQWVNGGAYAELAAAPASNLARKPPRVTFEQAASVPTSGTIALAAVRDQGQVQAGDTVLVNGAGGGVGMLAVQIAKAAGAEVTGVDRTGKLDLLRSLGAHHVVDFTKADFTRLGERYDLIVDIPGNHPFRACRRALTEQGTYVLVGHDQYGAEGRRWLGSIPRYLRLVVASPFTDHLPETNFATPDQAASIAALRDLLDEGRLTPVVDRTFPLGEVPKAIAHLAAGKARGKVVVTP